MKLLSTAVDGFCCFVLTRAAPGRASLTTLADFITTAKPKEAAFLFGWHCVVRNSDGGGGFGSCWANVRHRMLRRQHAKSHEGCDAFFLCRARARSSSVKGMTTIEKKARRHRKLRGAVVAWMKTNKPLLEPFWDGLNASGEEVADAGSIGPEAVLALRFTRTTGYSFDSYLGV